MNDDRDPLAAIRAELLRIELQGRPGIAKASMSSRDRWRSKVHAAFCAGVESLLLSGWSMRRIAQHMEVDPVTLKDLFEQGDRKRNQLPAWAIAALPRAAHAAVMRAMLGWSDPPSSERTGTDG